MAADKRYKKRKKRSWWPGAFIAVLTVCIGGGLLAAIGVHRMADGKKSAAQQSSSTVISNTGKEQDPSIEPTDSQAEDDSASVPQSTVSPEAENTGKTSENSEQDRDAWVEEQLAGMEMKEKVAQLFFVSLDSLTQTENTATVGDDFKERFGEYPVGGIVLSDGNIADPDQLKALTRTAGEQSRETVGINLFIGVEEEGGEVLKIANKPEFGLKDAGSMTDIGARDDPEAAYQAGEYIGSYLSEYGINVDFAPVADVIYNNPNSVVNGRAFGKDPYLVSDMVTKEVEGLLNSNVSAVLKHFPGHGSTEGDPSEGDAVSYSTLTELESSDYMPFRKGIEAGADFVMVGHIIMKNVNQSQEPASLSSYFMTDILKNEWGYEGIVITDDLSMAAIRNHYSPSDAAAAAINAGADMIFITSDFGEAFDGVMNAVNEGAISSERIDESVRRILRIKYMRQSNG